MNSVQQNPTRKAMDIPNTLTDDQRRISSRRITLVLAGHGSSENPESGAPIHRHADRIRRLALFDDVRPAFWNESPEFRRSLCDVGSEAVVIVPVFMSEGYYVQQVLPREFGIAGEQPDRETSVHLTKPIGTHGAVTSVILGRIDEIRTTDSVLERDPPGVALIGHGTLRNPNSKRAILDHAARVRRQTGFPEVHPFFLDEPPYVDDMLQTFRARSVIAVPLLIADGRHTRYDIPDRIGFSERSINPETGTIREQINGRRVWYSNAIG
ncbi:MAG TPA: CbiX/SirB N-terminal domain-containing protein, partial [bacterium]|nr:CbiX/SirB N-terminal domain-containing protein [bacterium]